MTTEHQHSPRDLRGKNLRDANLRHADLGGADLSGADLRGADLSGADFTAANLRAANLRAADLGHADLTGADLGGADLRAANLWAADLRGANLWDANLRGADLWAANLYGADLRGANLRGVSGGALQVTGLHPHQALMIPTAHGWRLRVGCWQGTTQDLRNLIAKDHGWPDARGSQVTARRPLLNALADMCDAHAANHQDALNAVIARWGNDKDNEA